MTPSILVVDDEPSLVRGLTYALEREGFGVLVATDGPEAVEQATNCPVDLVVLDRMLPTFDGTEACRLIREVSAVPIIMLTARDSERDVLDGLAIGADDYITKPFSSAELIARINALLRRRALDLQDDRSVRSVGAITIDLHRDEVRVDGRLVALTPSEFKILRLLSSRPGALFTRRQILEDMWGTSYIADEHACEVHVSSLRRKIEARPQAPERLVTVRGRGYRLIG